MLLLSLLKMLIIVVLFIALADLKQLIYLKILFLKTVDIYIYIYIYIYCLKFQSAQDSFFVLVYIKWLIVWTSKKLSIFGENDSRRLSYFLQTHIFWNFDHISRIYNQINYRNIWFPKVIITLIMRPQVLLSMFFFPKKNRTLMPLSISIETVMRNSEMLKFIPDHLKSKKNV